MKRRAFLRFLGLAGAAGPSVGAMVGDPVLAQTGFRGASLVGGAGSWGTLGGPADCAPADPADVPIRKIVNWIRRNGIPRWKMAEIEMRADNRSRAGIDVDLACLRSVSPGWKARKQQQRNLQREIDASLASLGRDQAMRKYRKRMEDQFGAFVDWRN